MTQEQNDLVNESKNQVKDAVREAINNDPTLGPQPITEFDQKTLKELREYKEAYNGIVSDIENFKNKIESLEKDIEFLKEENAKYMKYEDYTAARGTIDDLDAATKAKEQLEKQKSEVEAELEKRNQNEAVVSNAIDIRNERIKELKARAMELVRDKNELKYNHERLGYTNEQYVKLASQNQDQINAINEEIAMLLGVEKPKKEPEYTPGDIANHIEAIDKENREKLAEANGAVIEEPFTEEDEKNAGIDVDKADAEVKAEDKAKEDKDIDGNYIFEEDEKGRQPVTKIVPKENKESKASNLLAKIKPHMPKILAGIIGAAAIIGLAIVGGPIVAAALEGGSLGTLATLGLTGYAGSKAGVLKK